MSMDSYDGNLHDPQSLHKYTFGGDDPVNKIDPSGNDFIGADVGGALSGALGDVFQERLTFFPRLAPKCKVEVRFKHIGLGYNHAYILLTDTQTGTRYVYRGGPSQDAPGGSGSSGPLSGASGGSGSRSSGSDSSGSNVGSSPGGFGNGGLFGPYGPWGPIHCDHAVYLSGAPDWDPGNPPSANVNVNPNFSWQVYNQTFVDTLERINSALIPYNPLSTNSNAVARTVLQDSGLNPTKPSGWAPGWDTNLYQ